MNMKVSLTSLAVGLALAVNPAVAQEKSASKKSEKPNVIFFYADDMGYEIGAFGHPTIETPNIDKLALDGQRWTSFYVTSPVSSPSRGSLLTGRHQVRTGLYGEKSAVVIEEDPTTQIPDNELTLAKLMKQQGYATAAVGKWHLGGVEAAYPTRHGFDYWYGMPQSNDNYKTFTLSMKETVEAMSRGDMAAIKERQEKVFESYLDPQPHNWNIPTIRSEKVNGEYVDELVAQPTDQDYLTHNLTLEGQKFIEENKDNPFFLYLAYDKPHLPHFHHPDFKGKSPMGPLGDVMAEMDASVGKILDTLEENGLRDDTLIVLTSDNGPWMVYEVLQGTGGFLQNGKQSTYEGGVRVPAIFNWPGKIEPARVTGMGSTLDILPTLAALTNQELPKDMVFDGYDLSPTLLEGEPTERVDMPYYWAGEMFAYRYGDYKIHFNLFDVLNHGFKKVNYDKPELYNLMADPGERFDIAADNPEIVEELTKRAKAYDKNLDRAAPIFDQGFHDAMKKDANE
ncbi:sulfatase [Vibrio sp. 10N.286.52.C3]|uniref:sulfatase family protein n=1 Tax=unclassified Vibrio TaxID=2614977 RepID=UPI0035542963